MLGARRIATHDPTVVPLYFAYGSNLDTHQMRRRCPDSVPIHPSRLDNHELRFVGFSNSWQGGVATVHPAPGKTVPGVIYRLSPTDFERLDEHEGGYERTLIRVPTDNGALTEVQTYLHLEPDALRSPSPAYAAVIAHAYGRLGVDLELLKAALLLSAEG